jgi:hypothetical protein
MYFAIQYSIGTLQTNYFAETHPSLPNYIAMIAGDYFGIRSNNPVNLNYSNVVDLLEDRGLTWIIYQVRFLQSKKVNQSMEKKCEEKGR